MLAEWYIRRGENVLDKMAGVEEEAVKKLVAMQFFQALVLGSSKALLPLAKFFDGQKGYEGVAKFLKDVEKFMSSPTQDCKNEVKGLAEWIENTNIKFINCEVGSEEKNNQIVDKQLTLFHEEFEVNCDIEFSSYFTSLTGSCE